MSNYNPKRVVQDFASRTLRNLDFVDHETKNGQVNAFETTQLINSLLGLIVFPKRKFYKRLPATPLKQLIQEGWPQLRFSTEKSRCRNLRHLVRHLRNSISHCNIQFNADEANEIVGITLWDIDDETAERVWEASISLDDLKCLLRQFAKLLESIEPEEADEMVRIV